MSVDAKAALSRKGCSWQAHTWPQLPPVSSHKAGPGGLPDCEQDLSQRTPLCPAPLCSCLLPRIVSGPPNSTSVLSGFSLHFFTPLPAPFPPHLNPGTETLRTGAHRSGRAGGPNCLRVTNTHEDRQGLPRTSSSPWKPIGDAGVDPGPFCTPSPSVPKSSSTQRACPGTPGLGGQGSIRSCEGLRRQAQVRLAQVTALHSGPSGSS